MLREYYVFNHTDATVYIGDTEIPAQATRPTVIDPTEAATLKSQGWKVVRKFFDREKGLVEGSGSSAGNKFIELTEEFDPYVLSLEDNGVIIYGGSYSHTIQVPDSSDVAFPQGAMINFVTNGENSMFVSSATEGVAITGVGGLGTALGWIVPSATIATLLYLGNNMWYLTGPSIEMD